MGIDSEKIPGGYIKSYPSIWKYLGNELSAIQYKALLGLMFKTLKGTNSLAPINNKTTISELVEILGVSTNKVKPTLEKLYDLGVYRQLEVGGKYGSWRNYWVFNPYIGMNGEMVSEEIKELFHDTKVAVEYRKRVKLNDELN